MSRRVIMESPDPKILRALDANINRACEGLRVVEDIARFIWDDRELSERLKQTRHFLRLLFPPEWLLTARDSRNDVGQGVLKYGSESRESLASILSANLKRAQEAFRVIEEFAKLEEFAFSPETIRDIETNRYLIYSLEKDIFSRLNH